MQAFSVGYQQKIHRQQIFFWDLDKITNLRVRTRFFLTHLAGTYTTNGVQ